MTLTSAAHYQPSEAVTITVYGTPAPQGSKRHVGNGVMVESSKKVKPWRQDVKTAALAAGREMFGGPVEVAITFYLGRPKGHYGTGRNADMLRASAPVHPAVKPDIDKLLRSTFDALKEAGLYRDDSQVIIVGGVKQYARRGQPPGASITIREVWEQEP